MARRIPKDAMTRALAAATDDDAPTIGEGEGKGEGKGEGVGKNEARSPDADDPLDAPDARAVPDKLYFRIGEVAGLVGVDAHVLRYWESEFRMKPHRSSSGQRLYRKQDLSLFFRIKRLLHDQGYTIAGARKVLAGPSDQMPAVDVPRLRDALDHVQRLRDRILELRDELDPNGQA